MGVSGSKQRGSPLRIATREPVRVLERKKGNNLLFYVFVNCKCLLIVVNFVFFFQFRESFHKRDCLPENSIWLPQSKLRGLTPPFGLRGGALGSSSFRGLDGLLRSGFRQSLLLNFRQHERFNLRVAGDVQARTNVQEYALGELCVIQVEAPVDQGGRVKQTGRVLDLLVQVVLAGSLNLLFKRLDDRVARVDLPHLLNVLWQNLLPPCSEGGESVLEPLFQSFVLVTELHVLPGHVLELDVVELCHVSNNVFVNWGVEVNNFVAPLDQSLRERGRLTLRQIRRCNVEDLFLAVLHVLDVLLKSNGLAIGCRCLEAQKLGQTVPVGSVLDDTQLDGIAELFPELRVGRDRPFILLVICI